MRHMNRVLVGTMLEVAGGRRSPESFASPARGPSARGGRAHRARPTGFTSPASGTARPS